MSIRKKFAFTIIEVLVVVAIIGTLIAIGLNEYSSSLNTTRTVTFRENVSAIEDCLNVYFSVNHRYPDTLEEIRGCLNKTPINPFTNEDMLTDGSITYTPLDDNLEYVIVVHQPDEDDYDDDGNTTEPIIEPPVLLSENIHLIVHPAGAGTAKARPNPADSGVVVALSSQAGQCYNFNSWQPLSEITINSPTSPNTTFIMPGNEVSIVSKFDIKRYRVTLNAPGGEEVLGSGDYNCGDQVTVQAVPLTGHYFVGWYSGSTLVSVSPYYTFRIYNDVTLEARSAYYITLYANPEIGGSPTVSPNPAAYGDVVRLTSNPSTCYDFTSWTADVPINNNQFTMPPRNVIITANYTIKPYTIAITITKTGNSPNTPGTVTGAGTYNCGSSAKLVATPATGFSFAGWYEGTTRVSTTATYTFPVNGPRTLEARFSAIQYTITLKANPTGAGSPSASPNPANVGQTVTLSANPGSCYNFSSWSVSAGTLNGNTLTMPAQNVTATANYAIKTYTVSLSVNNTNYGTVSGGGTYDCGSSAPISATPKTGYHFVNWSDGNTSSSRSISVTSNVSLTANFAANTYTVSLSTDGHGTVSGAGTYEYGSNVPISATPYSGYHFDHWSDGSTSQSRTITITGNVNLTAYFAQDVTYYTITVSKSGCGSVGGGGTFAAGTSVNIWASPCSGYYFDSWSDGSTTSDRWVTANSNKTYIAYFYEEAPPVTYYTLSTGAVPWPGAHISPSTNTYAAGTTVNVRGWCDSGYDWVGFYVDGASCPSGASSCSITMNNDVYVEAHCQKRVSPLYATVNCSASPSTAGTCQACIGSTCGSRGSSSSVSVPCTSGSSFSYTTNPVGRTSQGKCYYTTSPSTGSVGCNSTKDVTLHFTLGMCQN